MAAAAKAKPSEELKRIVNDVAESMNEPPWQSKLLEAMDFVLTGAVSLEGGLVQSGAHAYQIDDQYGCTCVDAKVRKHTCKHAVAWEMQKRVDARMRGEAMPAKSKKNPQDEWEAGVQNSEPTEPGLFEDPTKNPDAELDEIEPDDIPEPEVPKHVKKAAVAAANPTPERQAMMSRADYLNKALEEVPVHAVVSEGHQYVNDPSTLCIKRHVGQTEIMWTFRGTMDEEVWGRASRMIRALDEANKRYAPPAPAAPQQQAQPAPQAPAQQEAPAPQATYATTAAGQIPMCPAHQRPMKPSQYEGFFCGSKNPDGSWCKARA